MSSQLGAAAALPSQRSWDVGRPIVLLLDTECEVPESCKALMALGHHDSQNKSTRRRVLKDAHTMQHIRNYIVKDRKLTRQAAVQYGTDLGWSEMRVGRREGNNNKGKD